MEPSTRLARALPDERTVRIAVIGLGIFHLLQGGWQLLAPGSFFDEIGRYGIENTHYVGDVGSFVAAYGVALLIAAGRPSWWAPLLAVGALWYGLHAINHLFDIDEARSDARGLIDTILLAIGAVLIAGLALAAERMSRDRGAPGREAEEGPRR